MTGPNPSPPPPALPPPPRGRVPSAVVAYAVVPMSTLLGLVLVAAVHQWLGAPLGPLWAAELWSLVKSGVFIVPVYWGLAARVRDHNTRVEAIYADHRAASLQPHHDHAASISAASHPVAERLTDGRRPITRPVLLPPSASTSRAIVVAEPDREEE